MVIPGHGWTWHVLMTRGMWQGVQGGGNGWAKHYGNCAPGGWAGCSLKKFVLSPGPKLGGLEQVSSQENSWPWHTANRLGRKCLCSFASHRCPCAYAGDGGRKMGNSSSLVFAEVSQYAPKSV